MKPTSVDPEQLAGVALAIGASAEDMANDLNGLQATVTADNPWGQDEQGSLFGLAYVEVLQHAIDVYGSHVDLLMGAAENLGNWVQEVARVEEGNAQLFRGIQSRLGG